MYRCRESYIGTDMQTGTDTQTKIHTDTAIDWFPWWLSSQEPTCQCRRHRRLGFEPWVRKILGRAWQPAPVLLPEESHGQRSLVGYRPGSHKESDTTEVTVHSCT